MESESAAVLLRSARLVVGKDFPCRNHDFFVVANEHVFGVLGLCGLRQYAHKGNDRKAGQHAEGAGIKGILEDKAQEFAADLNDSQRLQELDNLDDRRKTERNANGGLASPFPIQAVEEGGQEGAAQSAPTDAHKLRDEGYAALRLDNRDDG